MSGPPVSTREPRVRFAATGDLLLASGVTANSPPRDPDSIFGDVRSLLAQSDVVLGNLECTLPGTGETISTEPRVVTTPEFVRAVKSAGFNVVSLANNHTFDCLQAGFHNVRRLLKELGIIWFGAGDDLAQATAPAILELGGVRLAFLAGVDQRAGAPYYATPDHWGVAPMDVGRLSSEIRRLRQSVHHVILFIHWGEERLRIPSPEQIAQAHELADAGASMIIGHHPHVIQGMETHHGVPIIYSLGNAVASEVPYTNGDRLTWSRRERTGCLFLTELTATAMHNVRQVPICDSGHMVHIDHTGYGDKLIALANRALARGITVKRYRREYLWVKTIKPVLWHLRWSELKKLRAATVRKALSGIFSARKAR